MRVMSIQLVMVSQHRRMQGYGTVLMRWCVDKAKGKPRGACNRVTLSATPEAVPFYEHLKFSRMPQQESEEEILSECWEATQELPHYTRMELRWGKCCGTARTPG